MKKKNNLETALEALATLGAKELDGVAETTFKVAYAVSENKVKAAALAGGIALATTSESTLNKTLGVGLALYGATGLGKMKRDFNSITSSDYVAENAPKEQE